MIKNLLILLTLIIPHYIFAGSDKIIRFPASEPKYPKYVEECQKPATEKIKNIAKINNMTIDESSITVSSVDDRWYNPTKYVWFSAIAKKSNGNSEIIETLTQKGFLPVTDCF